MDKILTADFSSGKDRVTVRGLWQFDRGVKLKVIGINVADVNRVDFAPVIASEAVPVVVVPDGDGTFTVSIPGAATKSPYDVTAYIYVDTAEYGYTVKAVSMPVILRPEAGKPGEEEKPDPFGEVVEKVSGYATEARDSARAAAESEKAASESATQAEKAKEAAELSAEAAAESKEAAGVSASNAAQSASQSRESATAAQTAADQATKSATAAAESETAVTQLAENATQSAQNASSSAESASQSAETAKTAADTAGKSASGAQQAAGSAAESTSTATSAAQTATTAAGEAAASATSAARSAEEAGQKAAAAETSASNAAESAVAAGKSATAAGDSAGAAKTSETAAEEAAQTAQEQIEKNKAGVAALKEDTATLQKRQNVLTGSETGSLVTVDDAFAAPLCGLTVYGKSTQDGTPTPDAPVPIVSAGDGGTIAVTLSDGNGKTQTLTLPTPNGLPGIHVTSGGNYTDQNGQQWVCDEVDLERGVKVQRVNAVDLSTCITTTIIKFAVTKRLSIQLPIYGRDYKTEALCNKSPFFVSFNKDTPHFYVDKTNVQIFIPNDAKNPEEGEYILFYTLFTPIETPLTSDEIAAYKALTAYAPDTVVQASDGAGIKLDYQRDVNLVVKNLEDAMASMTTT